MKIEFLKEISIKDLNYQILFLAQNLMLAFFILTLHDNATIEVGESDGRFGFVDMLSTGSTRVEFVQSVVIWFQINVHVFWFRHHRDSCSRGVDELEADFDDSMHVVPVASPDDLDDEIVSRDAVLEREDVVHDLEMLSQDHPSFEPRHIEEEESVQGRVQDRDQVHESLPTHDAEPLSERSNQDVESDSEPTPESTRGTAQHSTASGAERYTPPGHMWAYLYTYIYISGTDLAWP